MIFKKKNLKKGIIRKKWRGKLDLLDLMDLFYLKKFFHVNFPYFNFIHFLFKICTTNFQYLILKKIFKI